MRCFAKGSRKKRLAILRALTFKRWTGRVHAILTETMRMNLQSIERYIWQDDDPIWAVLDCARDSQIYTLLSQSFPLYRSLYRGIRTNILERVAPHLVQLERGTPLSRSVLERGWGQAWGVFFRSRFGLDTLYNHWRRFLLVNDEANRLLIFRFYDPRVLRVYLPTCNKSELNVIFGPIEKLMLEGQTSGIAYGFSLGKETLDVETVSVC